MKNKTLILISFFLFLFSFTSKATEKIRVACVGNSVTYGATLENREIENYPAQLQLLLGEDYQVQNFGRSGTTLLEKGHRPYIKQEEYKKALEFKPEIVVIHLGLNDTDPRNWHNYKDDFIPDYLKLIDSFRQINSKAEVYICKLTPIFSGHSRFQSGTYIWYHQIQQAIEKTATIANVPLIDLNEDLYIRPDLFPDYLHPQAEGAEIIAKRVYASLTGDFGGLQLSPLFTDGMVLQRDKEILIKGKANANKVIKVHFGKISRKTMSDFQGNWELMLPAFPASKKGKRLTISSEKTKLTFSNVLVGDVWLCSGQSNMGFPFKYSAEYDEQKGKINKNLHLFHAKPITSESGREWNHHYMKKINRLEYFQTEKWTNATNLQAAKDFSAIALAFGSELADSLDVPVGLILNAVGGSPQESWISREYFEKNPAIIGFLNEFSNNDRIQKWVRTRSKQNTIKASNPLQQRHPYMPTYLFDTGIRPLNAYPIKGVIWYQGESNAQNCELYELLFHNFVDCWREYWNDNNLPIIFAQLSSIDRPGWEYFRNTQRELSQKINHVSMVVSSDLGDSLDVHPTQKHPIGERMSKTALAIYYDKDIIYSGPLYKSFEIKNQNIIIHFENNKGLRAATGNKIIGFEVAGKNTIYYPAKAIVEDDKIYVSSDKVKNPVSVRYAWQPFTRANLINEAGLPASTFETKQSYEK